MVLESATLEFRSIMDYRFGLAIADALLSYWAEFQKLQHKWDKLIVGKVIIHNSIPLLDHIC